MPLASEGSLTDDGPSTPGPSHPALVRHNLRCESLFSAFNGVFIGMAVVAAPVLAVSCLDASMAELTILSCAFPCGAFLGPLWARLGRVWGMKALVTRMSTAGCLLSLAMFWVRDAAAFTVITTACQLLYSAVRMGQSSMYWATYPRSQLGSVVGQLISWTFATLVPTVLLAGWLCDADRYPGAYRWLFPAAGMLGLVGNRFYARLRYLEGRPAPAPEQSLTASVRGLKRVIAYDRAYLFFQLAFFLSGSAFFLSNHITLKTVHDYLDFGAAELSLWLAVLPQALLALSSPWWGRIMDRVGIVRARMAISVIMTVYLGAYFLGVMASLPALICLGSVFRGLSEGGGQVTWAMASTHFAPRPEDVPLYNGIHFLLNGIRGLAMPWLGSMLAFFVGPWTILVAAAVSFLSIPVISRSYRYGIMDAAAPGADRVELSA